MKQLLVLSGKGGTGKSTVASAFIKLGQVKACADCDVDAPNLHLLMTELGEPDRAGAVGRFVERQEQGRNGHGVPRAAREFAVEDHEPDAMAAARSPHRSASVGRTSAGTRIARAAANRLSSSACQAAWNARSKASPVVARSG